MFCEELYYPALWDLRTIIATIPECIMLLQIHEGGKKKPWCSYITQETVPITLLEVATTHQPTVKICATDTWKSASRTETPYTRVSEKLQKKTMRIRGQYELTKMTNIKLISLACFFQVTRCWLQVKTIDHPLAF